MATERSIETALEELDRIAPDAPFLALGQTVLWDEPMKAGVALAAPHRRFLAGVHDTDYFAKLSSASKSQSRFVSVPHNDTTTKGLWSAAAEFSRLFGSETVVTRDLLQGSGLRLRKVSKSRPGLIDEATEAWGWRGVLSTEEDPPIVAEVALKPLFHELHRAFDWAIDGTIETISKPDRPWAQERSNRLHEIFCRGAEMDSATTLGQFYRDLLPDLYRFVSGEDVDIESTATTELLRFNRETCSLPRFALLDAFLQPKSRNAAVQAYNETLKGSEIYTLERFGTGAVPFDVVIPGKGRGTLRIGNRGLVIMARTPQFVSLKRPVSSVQELAEVLESKFGKDCVIIGKAVTLIGMLAREFIFVFHEGASDYVRHSRTLHGRLRSSGVEVEAFPILRVKYQAWDALTSSSVFFDLPEPFRRPFGAEEMCAPSFAQRWREVVAEQDGLLKKLGELKRPIELIQYLNERVGGAWNCLGTEYGRLHKRLEQLEHEIEVLRTERVKAYGVRRVLRQARVQAEIEKGIHFRAEIFDREASVEALATRQKHTNAVEQAIHAVASNEHHIRALLRKQAELVSDAEIVSIHERRRAIELEAELKRLRLIRGAIITSRGLIKSEHRPSAWWFPLVSPDGRWFKETMRTAEYYLEPLLP